MAARRKREVHHRPETIERIRESIQAGLIAKALNSHVLVESKLDKSQVSAAIALLKKCLPDLAVTQHTGDRDNPVIVETEIRPQLSRAEWEKRHVLKK